MYITLIFNVYIILLIMPVA